MKHSLSILTLTLTGALCLALSSSAHAQFTLNFDANGNGTVFYNGVTSPAPGVLAPDPTGGGVGNVLTYTLPTIVSPGDIAFTGFGSATIRDILRFYSSGGKGFLIFYSLAGGPYLADTGLPINANPALTLSETANGGIVYNVGINSYIGSNSSLNAVPEPGSIALLAGMSLSGIALLRRRRSVQKAA